MYIAKKEKKVFRIGLIMVLKDNEQKNAIIFHIDTPLNLAKLDTYYYYNSCLTNNNNNISNEDDLDTKNITNDKIKKSSNCVRNCCQYYFRCCMPCRRVQRCTCFRCLRCSRCSRKKPDNVKSSCSTDEIDTEKATITSSSAISCSPTISAINVQMINEKNNSDKSKKSNFVRKLCCCYCCKRKKTEKNTIPLSELELPENNNIQTISNETQQVNASISMGPSKHRKFCVCLSKILCCRSVNKVHPKTGCGIEIKSCFCIPCHKKRDLHETTRAWHDVEAASETNSTIDSNIYEQHREQQQQLQQQQNCCKRWCKFLFCWSCCRCRCRCCNCCRRKNLSPHPHPQPPPAAPTNVETARRRSSIKKPPEDTRRRLHVDLIEYNSKMKAAIPILPLWLAWLCAICNVLIPGLGTLLSGFICICVGIPRFSQYDSAKARVGSLIINIIVAVSQLFCVLFCFVGWGWSIWWATIMLKVAKKLCKIRRVERLELEEEQRQAGFAQQQAQQQHQ